MQTNCNIDDDMRARLAIGALSRIKAYVFDRYLLTARKDLFERVL